MSRVQTGDWDGEPITRPMTGEERRAKKEIKDIVYPYLTYNPDTGRHDVINEMPLDIFNQIIINVMEECKAVDNSPHNEK